MSAGFVSSPRRRWVNLGLGSVLGVSLLAAGIGLSGGSARLAASSSTPSAVVARAGITDSYADLVERVAPAVVTVRATRSVRQTQFSPQDDLLRRFFGDRDGARDESGPRTMPRRQGGLGSGVVVAADGYILTNNHVVEGADKVRVEFTDGRSLEARVVGTDKPSDLAVLKVAATGLTTLGVGDSDRVRVGDVVLAIGNPLGVGQTVTMGIVSGKGRATGSGDGAYEDFIQTDAPINQGNSGGALISTRGELVGINSQILSPVGFNIGIGFAIPSNMAQNVLDQIVKTGSVRRGLLGVTVQGVNADLAKSLGLTEVRGAIVTDVTKEGAAAKAGIAQGDVILAVNGQRVDSSNALRNQIARTDPGTSVSLTVLRDGRERQVQARLGELAAVRAAAAQESPEGEADRFGMTVRPLTPELAKQAGVDVDHGVFVAEVDPEGAAAEAGIQSGDVITQVNGKAAGSVAEFKAALGNSSPDKPALLLVSRRGGNLFVTLSRVPE
jgi:Do/DeqQ family serine protease